jgi:ADP-dependent NAD(P)H-hydrate dehydratase / NAD(P)H-hydrate epimerase
MTPGERSSALLTSEQMGHADRAAIVNGIPGVDLMEAAGRAVAEACRARWRPRAVTVLCGPGNNGGDGFVAARHLATAGWPVRLALLGSVDALKGDAAHYARLWTGPVEQLRPDLLDGAELVIDAIFGAGLTRPLDGNVLAMISAIHHRKLDCVAVDLPSGVQADTGAVLGDAPYARLTVTFFRKKPGHLLLPGRMRCGETLVADIGIPDSVLDAINPTSFENSPALWLDAFPEPQLEDHKYRRGHAAVYGGTQMTGAARLAAEAARRIGAGLLTILSAPEAASIYAMAAPGHLVKVLPPDGRIPQQVLSALAAGKALVLDADALTAFSENPQSLFDALTGNEILTPHEGEFARLFPSALQEKGKIDRARAAAALCGAIVVLKGADTVIAAPDGRAIVNANAPADLATGGTGDVLAGMILGLRAQGVPPVDAAAMAVWLHGAAGAAVGPGLIAEDIGSALRPIIGSIRALRRKM